MLAASREAGVLVRSMSQGLPPSRNPRRVHSLVSRTPRTLVSTCLKVLFPVLGTSPCGREQKYHNLRSKRMRKAVGGGRNERGAYSFSLEQGKSLEHWQKRARHREIGPRMWRRIKKIRHARATRADGHEICHKQPRPRERRQSELLVVCQRHKSPATSLTLYLLLVFLPSPTTFTLVHA